MVRTVWRFLNKVKLELPNNPAIPFLGIYPEKTLILKDRCTPMFIAGLFIILRTWEPPRCPSTDEWIKMQWIKMQWIKYTHTHTHTHNGVLLSHKKQWKNATCSNID